MYSLIILAGSRPGGDPLAREMGAAGKALIPIGGEAMIAHVVRQFCDRDDIAAIHIVTELEGEIKSEASTKWIGELNHVHFHPNSGSIASAVSAIFGDGGASYPAIITTADNPLITKAMIDQFLTDTNGADIGIAMVERKILESKYPANRRTWLKFKGGQYSGANLFLLGSAKGQKIKGLWANIEQDRKKGWKILTLMGPWLLMLVLMRLVSLQTAARRMSRKTGVLIMPAALNQAEACIDVDKPDDVALAETIMRHRKAAA